MSHSGLGFAGVAACHFVAQTAGTAREAVVMLMPRAVRWKPGGH